MKFVEEVVVEEVLPTFRSMLAEALRERGLTQQEVAEVLGVSQSAVSKYVHGEVTRRQEVADHPRIRELVEEVADGLAEGRTSRVGALVEAEVLLREMEAGGLVARLHEEAMPELSDHEGRIRDPESPVRTAEQVLSSVRRGLRTLENAGGFAAHIPAVGSNLCECLPDAEAIEDVAGVPGRIVDVKGRATVPAEPEFGASEHVARVLLAAREAARASESAAEEGTEAAADATAADHDGSNPEHEADADPDDPDSDADLDGDRGRELRAALNVAYDPRLIERLAAGGLEAVEFDAETDIEAAVRDAVRSNPEARVLYQTGGFGIEPVAYVLGPDAAAVARSVREAI